MKATLNWLKQYVDFNWSPEELRERLPLIGIEVASLQKLGGEFANAPILIDRLQGFGTAGAGGTNPKATSWYTVDAGKRIPTACHRGDKGAPTGGNFLFEDGHVSWYQKQNIEVGSFSSPWLCFYKIPISQ